MGNKLIRLKALRCHLHDEISLISEWNEISCKGPLSDAKLARANWTWIGVLETKKAKWFAVEDNAG